MAVFPDDVWLEYIFPLCDAVNLHVLYCSCPHLCGLVDFAARKRLLAREECRSIRARKEGQKRVLLNPSGGLSNRYLIRNLPIPGLLYLLGEDVTTGSSWLQKLFDQLTVSLIEWYGPARIKKALCGGVLNIGLDSWFRRGDESTIRSVLPLLADEIINPMRMQKQLVRDVILSGRNEVFDWSPHLLLEAFIANNLDLETRWRIGAAKVEIDAVVRLAIISGSMPMLARITTTAKEYNPAFSFTAAHWGCAVETNDAIFHFVHSQCPNDNWSDLLYRLVMHTARHDVYQRIVHLESDFDRELASECIYFAFNYAFKGESGFSADPSYPDDTHMKRLMNDHTRSRLSFFQARGLLTVENVVDAIGHINCGCQEANDCDTHTFLSTLIAEYGVSPDVISAYQSAEKAPALMDSDDEEYEGDLYAPDD
jgi:hypothetical protein